VEITVVMEKALIWEDLKATWERSEVEEVRYVYTYIYVFSYMGLDMSLDMGWMGSL
jgi:hypothetical protein